MTEIYAAWVAANARRTEPFDHIGETRFKELRPPNYLFPMQAAQLARVRPPPSPPAAPRGGPFPRHAAFS